MSENVIGKSVGRLPVYCGEWSDEYNSGNGYFKYNEVSYAGSLFISTVDGNTGVPCTFTRDSSGNLISYNVSSGWKIVANALDASIAVTNAIEQLDGASKTTFYLECSTASSSEVKTVSASGFALDTHVFAIIKMVNANTHASPKLNINSTGSVGITYNGAPASDDNTWGDNEVVDVYYDGSTYCMTTHSSSFKGEIIATTYNDLIGLRDSSALVPGQKYRITDYECTTVQSDTISANHHFDIIVTAIGETRLSENALASHHEGDTYFQNCDLDRWKLRYCIDNDTDRFAWADSSNGKGVVYDMTDEWNNRCPYDFKNIQFTVTSDLLPKRFPNVTLGDSYYTFSNIASHGNIPNDMTVTSGYVRNNTIKPANHIVNFINQSDETVFLNYIIFTTEYETVNNYIGENSSHITFETGNSFNTIECGGYKIHFNAYNKGNYIGQNCTDVYVPNYCDYNKIGNGCNNIDITDHQCKNNTIGNNASNVSFTYGDCNCSIGNDSSGVIIGNTSNCINIGNRCNGIYFGSGITISDVIRYYNNITIEPQTSNVILKATSTLSVSSPFRNVVVRYVKNNNPTIYEVSGTNQTYRTVVQQLPDNIVLVS